MNWRSCIWTRDCHQSHVVITSFCTSIYSVSVPSVIIPQERNYLLNSDHPMFEAVVLTASEVEFSIDPGLWQEGRLPNRDHATRFARYCTGCCGFTPS